MAARSLSNAVLVLTGASSGIGAAVAEAAGAAGMRAVLNGRRAEKLQAVAERVRAAGGEALAVPGDVTREADVEELFAAAAEAFGGVDAVLANAGYGLEKRFDATSMREHRAIFETNHFGTLLTLRAGLAAVRAEPGGLRHLLVTSSCVSELGPPRFGAYAATKAAQDAVAQALRAEVAAEGIRVTTIHPVGTRTEFFDTAAANSGTDRSLADTNTPDLFTQTAGHVARRVIAALKRPVAEVWPSRPARFAFAAATAFPGLTAWGLARAAARMEKQGR
ncbi:SDR family NAD(P)-dependent oxidoreductase [Phycisphaera mikurensis]|uniref:Putative oxidoreductase n=1 Tax=Phycisphaera mikurensis (strain NBRC 102666 / KCTC 22515 / FYK2301M01) TaxID=1142394 RepID=I0IIP4_PHYMF|nr:SDR family oxidoreductase [Phycisphaera mikurensis]MBB6442716.1 short-subunit dehydrogenase [Phycisphaera mikurensis]BAM05132.1 putative oxidoreductase [Phycisphaera mikurensis NBRC 102666]